MFRLALKVIVVLLLLALLAGCDGSSQRPEPAVDEAAEPTAVDVPASEETVVDEPASDESGFDCTAVQEIDQAACEALVAFYEATDGAGWHDHTGWLENTTPCGWVGVSCVNGRVDILALPFNNLQGQLPEALAGLAPLRVLDLHNNGLS